MKTEKQKMLEGLVYDAGNDAELLRERTECADALHTYNSLLPSDTSGRAEILRKLFASTGRNFTIVSPFYCDYGYNISVGENFFMNTGCVILDGAEVSFGDDVFVAPMCGFYTAGSKHRRRFRDRCRQRGYSQHPCRSARVRQSVQGRPHPRPRRPREDLRRRRTFKRFNIILL